MIRQIGAVATLALTTLSGLFALWFLLLIALWTFGLIEWTWLLPVRFAVWLLLSVAFFLAWQYFSRLLQGEEKK